tara:strand:+ start:371 stop:1093 length:723 start_codon:yes stop_codon:yes gene_type:complete
LTNKIKKALILAAGKGTRIRGITKNKPKCLLRFKDKTIIEILIEKLRSEGINKITVVTGYQSEKIKKKLKNSVKYINYPNYNKTNNLHTLLYAKRELNEPLLCIFSDLLLSQKIIKKMALSKKDICLAIDTKSKLEGTMRVKKTKNHIVDIGSHIKTNFSNGNFIGLSKFSKFGCKHLKESLNRFKDSHYEFYYTEALNSLIKDKKKINFIDISKYTWKEIDTKKDYDSAKKNFLNKYYL